MQYSWYLISCNQYFNWLSSRKYLIFNAFTFLHVGSFGLESHNGPKWKSQIQYKVEVEVIEAENTKVNESCNPAFTKIE